MMILMIANFQNINTEIYSSVNHMEYMLNIENDMLENLNAYIDQQSSKVEYLKK